VNKTEAIKAFLMANAPSDLASLYSADMECQVNVAQDGGTRVESSYQGRQWHGWTDEHQLTVWKSFRIPYNASTKPEYNDTRMSYSLDAHAEGIGMTGWDWKNLVSRWFAFDFDAISGHSDKHQSKLTQEQLKEVQDAASSIPWVTVRKSTSGKGLHLYVFLEPVPTANHNEHAALARAMLGKMSIMTKFDFQAKVDICGGNMWCWHRKMRGTDGLQLIKQGEKLPADMIPVNWRDHVKVVKGRAKKAVPKQITDSEVPEADRMFEELCGKRTTQSLDDDHKKLIKYLEERGAHAWWDNDHGMLVAHTYDLKCAHEELNMRGIFRTESKGTEQGADKNCYLFPNRRGSWTVRRFTPGVKEDPTWNQDGAGWTYCYLNKEADLKTAARAFEGVEQEKGGFMFQQADQAQQAAQLLGVDLRLPVGMLPRKGAVLKEHPKDGRLMAHVPADPSTDDAPKMTGWLNEKGVWKRIYGVQVSTSAEEAPVQNYDDTVRHIVTSQREDAGWVLRSDDRWSVEPLGHVKEALLSTGVSKKDITTIIGQSIIRPWEICNLPFQPEYPGERKWNRDAAQVRFHPSEDRENLKHPTWDKVLQHLGKDLDEAVKENSWAINNGIVSGADYLKCWISSLFQEPTQPLPYLFFWSTEQNTGKSTLHEALRLLVTKGYVRADHALSSNTDFNGELENAVICVIEETDLGKNNKALNRIKDWVTSPMLPIRRLYQTAYAVVNTTHWIQCNNSPDACPILPGDSRIVMIHVSPLDLMEMIPKKALFPLLEAEAADFLASVLALELPESNDRLNIPIIETRDKLATARNNETPLARFIHERCYYVPGEVIEFSEFYERFIVTVEPSERGEWSKIKVGRNLPTKFPGARLRKTGFKHVGNMSWFVAPDDATPKKKLIEDKEGYLAEDDT
jgi:hypothetical protein